jgi:hypothetical protein
MEAFAAMILGAMNSKTTDLRPGTAAALIAGQMAVRNAGADSPTEFQLFWKNSDLAAASPFHLQAQPTTGVGPIVVGC